MKKIDLKKLKASNVNKKNIDPPSVEEFTGLKDNRRLTVNVPRKEYDAFHSKLISLGSSITENILEHVREYNRKN